MQPGNLPKRSPKRPDRQNSLSRAAVLRPTKRANRTFCRPKIDNTDSSSQLSDASRGIFDVIGQSLPHRIVQIAVAVVFLAGATLVLRGDPGDQDEVRLKAAATGFWAGAATSFGVILLAELGNLSDI